MSTVKVTTTQHIDIEYEAADVGDRIVAYIIDLVIWICVFLLVFVVMTSSALGSVRNSVIVIFGIVYLLYACYDLLCEIFFNGQSVGKRAMNIRVVSVDGKQPSLGQYLLRWVFRIVDILLTSGVGAIVAISATDRKQRIGDLVAHTTVIKTTTRVSLSALAVAPPLPVDYEAAFPTVTQLSDVQVQLVRDVLANYAESYNYDLIISMARRIKSRLDVAVPPQMDDLTFLKRVVQDFTYLTARG